MKAEGPSGPMPTRRNADGEEHKKGSQLWKHAERGQAVTHGLWRRCTSSAPALRVQVSKVRSDCA